MNKFLFFMGLFLLTSSTSFEQNTERGMKPGYAITDSISTNYALVIGISNYAYINPLEYADDDAEYFADYLVKQNICERKNIFRLIDSAATRVGIFRELKRIAQIIKSNDRVFIYFAGHGDVESDIERGYFLPYDCLSNNYSATGINLRDLEDFVALYIKKNAKIVLITDACRSGNLTGGLSGAASTMSSLARGFTNVIKLVSCQPNQLSQEKNYPGGGHGVFTYHLIDGLTGLADQDGDSSISVWEIDRYLDKVRIETNKKQTPEVEGDKEKRIVHFNQKLLLALITQKKGDETVAVRFLNRYRGPEDSTWLENPFFRTYRGHLFKREYIGSGTSNALSTIREASDKGQPVAMVDFMKLELSSVLEDVVQKWISKYLRGELGNNNEQELAELKKLTGYLETVESLIEVTDLHFNDIHLRKIFIEAYYIYRSRNRPQFEMALARLEEAHALKPIHAWIFHLCGNFYRVLGKNEAAETAYRQAMRLSPTWCYPWLGLAILNRINLKNFPAAEEAFRKVVTLNPTYVPGWNEMGKFYWSLNRLPEAENAFRQALQSDSLHFPDVWLDYGNLCCDQQKYGEAERAFYQAIAIDSSFAYPWNNLGNLYLTQKKFPEAEKAFQKAIDLLPGYADPFYSLGSLQALAGNHEKALSLLEQAFKNGFIQYEFLDADPYWNILREKDVFKALLKKYRK